MSKDPQQAIPIIPLPNSFRYTEGECDIDKLEVIITELEIGAVTQFAQKIFGVSIKKELNQPDKVHLLLEIDQNIQDINDEGYYLTIKPTQICIRATAEAGLYYGLRSLEQIILHNTSMQIPCAEIIDSPRFPWRGFMLDECRHFYGKSVVMKILRAMASLKMNRFHWHLTEDQGWRIEIKKYPKLTEIGSKRLFTQVGGWFSRKNDEIPHEGYYTQDDIREIIKFGEERFITIIPEIEMPGHSTAAVASYPELGCTGEKIDVSTTFGIKKDIYCAGKESTFEFLTDVLDEVIELFPSDVIHIGGDEVPKKRWKECELCQKRINDENLEDEEDLQVYFTNRIAKYLEKKGKRAMGWNEILDENLAPNAIGQWWARDTKKVLKHLKNGRDFVNSRIWYAYIDYRYELIPLWKSYEFNPIPKGLPKSKHNHMLGLEAPMWTEWVPDTGRLYWQTFPRLMALAEVGWTEIENKDYEGFKKRLPAVIEDLERFGIKSAPLEETEPGILKRIFNAWKVINNKGTTDK